MKEPRRTETNMPSGFDMNGRCPAQHERRMKRAADQKPHLGSNCTHLASADLALELLRHLHQQHLIVFAPLAFMIV
jgi:hypothetical protein